MVLNCPRNPSNIPCCEKACQRDETTEFPPHFHSGNSGRADARAIGDVRTASQAVHSSRDPEDAQRYGSSALQALESAGAISSRTRTEDGKLRKDLTLEVLTLKVPFGSLLFASESSPVAGAIRESIP